MSLKNINDIGLKNYINIFSQRAGIESKLESDFANVFENFSNYLVGSFETGDILLDDYSVISTETAEGIDGIIFLINKNLIKEIEDIEKFKDHKELKLQICFIQSKTGKSFEKGKFELFLKTVKRFLKQEEDLYKQKGLQKHLDIFNEIKESIWKNLFDNPEIIIYYSSARHNAEEKIASNELDETLTELENMACKGSFHFLSSETIKEKWKKVEESEKATFEMHKCIANLESSVHLVSGLIQWKELKKLVSSNSQKIRDTLFLDNVRDYQGKTEVNQNMEKTIKTMILTQNFTYLTMALLLSQAHLNKGMKAENASQ